MTDFQFINAMSEKHRIAGITDGLVAHANKQHYRSVYQAKQRRYDRATMRCAREIRRANILSAAVTTAILVGTVVASWFLSAVAAN